MINRQNWERRKKTKIKCLKCGDILYSEYEGDFNMCSCKSSGIDESELYCRLIGYEKDYEIIEEGESLMRLPKKK